MRPKTAWTRAGSSFPSDSIQPSRPKQSTAPNFSKGKGKRKESPLPKSDEVQRLETLHDALQTPPKSVNPNLACFCQAQKHALSSYTPICKTCGLVLCNLNLPQYTCPHCSSALLTTSARESLVQQLASQIEATLEKETAERQHLLEEARRAAGAFPPLAAKSSTPSPTPDTTSNRPHKVMSLVGKTDKVIVSSYYSSSRPETPRSEIQDSTEQPQRVSPPPREVSYAKKDIDPTRPWVNLRRSGLKYIPPSRIDG